MRNTKGPIVCLTLAQAAALARVGADDALPPLFPFVISYDAQDSASSMAHLLDAPAAKHGFVRAEQDEMILQFLRYWKELTGVNPDWLYFDSKATTYPVLDQLH